MCQIQILAVRGSSVRGAAESFIDVEGDASECVSGVVVITIQFDVYEVTSRAQVTSDGIWAARQIRARSWCEEVITVNAYCEEHPECAAAAVRGTIVCSDIVAPPPDPPLRHNGFLVAYVQPRYLLPGQPFRVYWSLFDDEHPADPTRAQLQWEPGARLAPPASAADSWTNVSPIAVGPAEVGAAVNRFYRVHDDDLVLQATNGRTFLVRLPQFSVRPTPSPIVTFTAPPLGAGAVVPYPYSVLIHEFREARWKAPYMVSFTLQNPSPFADMTLSFSLTEAENVLEPYPTFGITNVLGPAIPLPHLEAAMRTVRKGETVTVNWLPLVLKDWPWLDTTTFAAERTARGFTYQITVTGTDEFGNALAPVVSDPTTVVVSVSAQKIHDAMIGMELMLWFYFLSLVGVESLAAVTQLVAQQYGVNAQDPPLPDPDFEDFVVTDVPELPAALTKHDGLRKFSSWITHLFCIAVLRASLYKIEAKYLGARNAKSEEGYKKQADSYREVFRKIAEHAAHVADGAGEAAREMSAVADPKAMSARSTEVSVRGFSAAEIELFRKHGLDAKAIVQVGNSLPKHGGCAEPWSTRLARISDSTRRSIDALARDSVHILAELKDPESSK